MEDISVWPHWEIVSLLGEGGFGKVYKAKRETLGEVSWSAIKVVEIPKDKAELKDMETSGLSESHIKDYYKQSVKELINEIKLMEKMKSASHIVSIEDYEVVENKDAIGWKVYIRMELLINIVDYMKNYPMDKDEVMKMAHHILTALEYCHQEKLIHRDIKPGNIFLSGFGEYKLGDFGISREVEKTNATLSQKGTKSYMAPEMIRMDKYDKTVDLYALGLTMYEILNHGRMPFLPSYPEPFYPQDRMEAMTRRIMGEAFPEIEGIGELNKVIQKACAFDPKDRYQSATEMKEALNLLGNGKEIDIKDDKTEVIGEDNLEDIYKYLNNINTEKPERKEEKREQEDKKKYEVELESIIEYVVDNFEKKEGINLKEDSLAMTRIKEASIKAKKVLEKEGNYQMEIQYIAISQTGPKHLNMTIHIQSVLNYKQFTNAKSNSSNQSFKQSHVKEDRQLEPLQIKCPKCGKISYYMFRHGYRCPSCGHIFLTDINDDKGLKLKELLLKVAQSDPNDKTNIIGYYKQMIEIAPDSAQIYYRIGLNYGALNEEERAIKHYKKALSLDDRDASFYHSLGVIDINNGNYQSALKYFDKAYDLIINDSYTISDLKGLFYANYAVLMEETNQSERAFHFLKKARENGFNQCTNKIKYFDAGVEYTGKIVKEILEKHSYQLSWSNKNFFVDPIAARTNEQLRSFNIHEKDDPYLYISPSLISFSGNIKRGSGIFEGIVLCKKAFYFLSSKNPKGYFEMMYFNLADYDISYKNKKIIIKNILIDNGVRKDAIIHTGADGKIVVLMLQEIQNFFKK